VESECQNQMIVCSYCDRTKDICSYEDWEQTPYRNTCPNCKKERDENKNKENN